MTTRKILFIASAIALTFVQEQLLIMIPNVQFTIVLIYVFVSVFSFKESLIYITIYVILDNLYLGGFNLFNVIPMFVSWNLIPLFYHTVLKQTKNEKLLAISALCFGFIYSWSFFPGAIILYGLKDVWKVYILSDIPFELILATTGFVTVLWLYKPLYNIVSPIIEKE